MHCHGGLAVTKAILKSLSAIPGFRPSDPGEFINRAFMDMKLDLTQVEGIYDLIHAETELQRKQALKSADGVLSRCYVEWRDELVECQAMIEAYLDFSDDEELPPHLLQECKCLLTTFSRMNEPTHHL